MILVGTLHLRLISLLCVPALLLLFVLLRFCCGCEKRSPSTEHRPFLSRIVVTLVLSLATFRHIPSVSTPPLRAPRPQNRVHLQGVAKAAAASMKSHRNGSLVLKRTVGVAGKTLDAFRKQAGQPNSSSKHYSPTEAALWPCTCYVLHANEFSRRAHYIWRHLSLGEFQFCWALDWIAHYFVPPFMERTLPEQTEKSFTKKDNHTSLHH